LRYKDYYQQQTEKYTNILDSCILYLRNNPNLDARRVEDVVIWIIRDCREKMKYIGVPDIYYRMAPLLALTNRMNLGEPYNNISVGGYYLWSYFLNDIKNIPTPDHWPPDWDKSVPLKMYKWMIENKDNYQLDTDSSDSN